ncbi:hypothetical protein [Rhodococcus sp. T2V]|uniref:hypothetical protein n=1 Tax=Rhodococcus sp. T2V TaxID=3034164 RepID=UPI0023E34F34|nr:hypothetical protein [Rhodococcus sp. T2V]
MTHPIYDHVVDWENAPKDWFPPKSARSVERWFGKRVRDGKGTITSDSVMLKERWLKEGVQCQVVLPAADEEFIDTDWPIGDPNVVGYFGSVREAEIDLSSFLRLIDLGFQVNIVGPIDGGALAVLGNSKVACLSGVDIGGLPAKMKMWGMIILPYRETSRSASIVPAKLWNCLATRKTVLVGGLMIPAELTQYEVESPVIGYRAFNISQKSENVPSWTDRFKQILTSGDLA